MRIILLDLIAVIVAVMGCLNFNKDMQSGLLLVDLSWKALDFYMIVHGIVVFGSNHGSFEEAPIE